MAKVLSQAAIFALENALSNIFWYKRELRKFLTNIIRDTEILNNIDWEDHKRSFVSEIMERLNSNPTKYSSVLTKLCFEVVAFDNFSHLKNLDDGEEKEKLAKEAVKKLKKLIETKNSEDEAIKIREKNLENKKKNTLFKNNLDQIKNSYLSLITANDHQQRGIELEKLIYSLFNIFDLDPKASFSLNAEKIDGAFSLEGTEYLLEAKWQQPTVSRHDLDAFQSKISRKLDNTLGLFLSINGFSSNAIQLLSASRCSMILMDGADLMAVLEERIDFAALILRKKKHASTSGEIFFPFSRIAT